MCFWKGIFSALSISQTPPVLGLPGLRGLATQHPSAPQGYGHLWHSIINNLGHFRFQSEKLLFVLSKSVPTPIFYPVKIYLNSGRKLRWKLCGWFWDLLHFYGTLWLGDHAEWDLFLQVWAPLASSRDITYSDNICSPENIPTVCSLMISPMSEDICQVATLRLSSICVANYDLATV